eukprot:snap_masked-scaffold_93-processed-gene-0.14-mRNA-1 protein AED:0.27 eAED:0.34 QI:0/-1/0/1/-1/1/1/0/212
MIDSLTRTTLLHQCIKVGARKIVKALWEWGAFFHLAPEFLLVTVQGCNFVNAVVQKFIHSCNGIHKVTAAYISQTAGTVKVQNREVLRHLRFLVSECGLPSNAWGGVVLTVQMFLNSTPLSYRGADNRSPLGLLMGIKPRVSPIESVALEVSRKDVERIGQVARELQERIRIYQKKAYSKGLFYRFQANKRTSKGVKLIFFHPGEYVLLSEK